MQHLHVARVRRRAVEDLRRPRIATHQLGYWSVFDAGEAGTNATAAIGLAGEKQIPQALRARLLLQLLGDRNRLPRIARHTICVELGLPLRLVWFDALLDKRFYSVIQLFCMVGEAE